MRRALEANGEVHQKFWEWKAAIEDPQTLKRFRHFVNAEETDKNVLFVEERGQIRPATAEERAAKDTVAA